jgi:hypothetical protein
VRAEIEVNVIEREVLHLIAVLARIIIHITGEIEVEMNDVGKGPVDMILGNHGVEVHNIDVASQVDLALRMIEIEEGDIVIDLIHLPTKIDTEKNHLLIQR